MKSTGKYYKLGTFLSSEGGQNGCFLAAAAAAVGDMELKWRRFRSGSPVLPIETTDSAHQTLESVSIPALHSLEHCQIIFRTYENEGTVITDRKLLDKKHAIQ